MYQTPNWSKPYTEHLYDPIGRAIRTNHPDGTYQTVAFNKWTTTIQDAKQHQKQTIADAFGRTIQVKEYTGSQTYTLYATTDYQYDTLNRLTQVTDASNNQTTMNYDWLGRKIAMSDPDLGAWQYRYDSAGNLTKQRDAKNQVTCFYYDSINRLLGKTYHPNITNIDALTCSGGYTVAYTYDAGTYGKGRRTGMSDNLSGATVSTSWVFDKQGRVTSQTDTIPGASAYTTSWTYDAMSRARVMTYPDGEQVATTYDVQGPMTLGVYVTKASYNEKSQLTMLNLGNSLTTSYTYHPQNMRLTQLTTTGGLQNLSYQYDNVGNVTRITDTVRSEISNFAYDDLDRLTSVTGAYTQGWVYNAIGNITQRTGVNAATFTYGDANHKHAVTQVGNTAYTYDANGNMATRGSDALTYNAENRLTQATVGGVVTQSVYNGDGARVKKVVGSTATYYVGNWFEVTNGAITKYYYFGTQRVAMKQGSAVTYLHGDHLGSTSVTSGAQPSSQTYYPYGAVRNGTLPTDYTFTGQKRDNDAGLHFYNARYYDSGLGRFTQPDTIVPNQYNPQSLNRYAYVLNNPVKYTDPTGHAQVCADGDEGGGCGTPGRYVPEPPAKTSDRETEDGKPKLPVATGGQSIGPDPNYQPVCKLNSGLSVVSVTYIQVGIGSWGVVKSVDIVKDKSGKIWVYDTYAPTGYGGTLIGDSSMSPQVGISYQTGFIPNLEHVGDYMGYAKVHGGSFTYATGEKVIIDPGKVEGFYLGGDISQPIASIWSFTTYSKPIAEIWPNFGLIR